MALFPRITGSSMRRATGGKASNSGFRKGWCRTFSSILPQYPGGRNVPITAAHLQNVVDPLSAIVLLSQARLNRGEACNKRLPIFDGKIRYDLVLSPKGTRNVGSAGNLRGTAYVCSVRFVPIAGHKMGNRERLRVREHRHRSLACPSAGSGFNSTVLHSRADARGNGIHGDGEVRCADTSGASRARRLKRGTTKALLRVNKKLSGLCCGRLARSMTAGAHLFVCLPRQSLKN